MWPMSLAPTNEESAWLADKNLLEEKKCPASGEMPWSMGRQFLVTNNKRKSLESGDIEIR